MIKALGFDPEPLPALWGEPALEVSRWGTLKVGQTSFMSSLPGVFGAGDIVRGASLVVWAIRDGRDAAEQIHRWLERNAAEAPHAGRRGMSPALRRLAARPLWPACCRPLRRPPRRLRSRRRMPRTWRRRRGLPRIPAAPSASRSCWAPSGASWSASSSRTARTPQSAGRLVDELLLPAFRSHLPELTAGFAQFWARSMTTQQLDTADAFFRSPTGRRMVEVQIESAPALLAVGQAWGERVGREVLITQRDALRQRGVSL